MRIFRPKARLWVNSILKGLLLGLVCSCAPYRKPVPVGLVPEQGGVSADDELYGHQVLNMLTQRYPLDRNDARINRVRSLVDRLLAPTSAADNPWHVYVLDDEGFENASATRGNYIFVWTGMLKAAQDDEELATVLAHEIGHVLAGHPQPTPAEEVSDMLAGVAGTATGHVAMSQGSIGLAAGLADYAVRQTIRALLVNPEAQRKEYEADEIGLFLMADAGFNPEKAVDFWRRMKERGEAFPSVLQAMSTHPASADRVSHLNKILPQAAARYAASAGRRAAAPSIDPHGGLPAGSGDGSDWDWSASRPKAPSDTFALEHDSFAADGSAAQSDFSIPSSKGESSSESIWVVTAAKINVYSHPDVASSFVSQLMRRTHVIVRRELPQRTSQGRWLEIVNPISGYVQSRNLAPLTLADRAP